MPVMHNFNALRAALLSAKHRKSPRSKVMVKLRQQAIDLVMEEELNTASFSYELIPLEQKKHGVFQLQDATIEAPWLIPESGELTALAVGVCTLGPKLEQRVSQLFEEKRPSLALALDDLGTEMIFNSGERMRVRIERAAAKQGLSVSGQLSPGDPGLDFGSQGDICRLAKAEEIGLVMADSGTLQPFKSTSMLFGVGIDLPKANWSRCDTCRSRHKCKHAQLTATPQTSDTGSNGVPLR